MPSKNTDYKHWRIALFVPCYIDQFYPQVAVATLELLEKLGCQVHYPARQTCCGQPLANSGMEQRAKPIYEHFVETFAEYDYIVTPSGSCTYHVRHHYDILPQNETVAAVRKGVLDLTEFLVDILRVEHLDSYFPHRVSVHQSCHGLRGLRLGSASELMDTPFSKVDYLLDMVKGIERVKPSRPDECCGFGGTFAVNEAALSVKMGQDRLTDHQQGGAEYITATDMSCLMHLAGIISREQRPLRVLHLAEILNSTR